MLALTIMIGLLIVVPNGRWRDLVRPVAPALAEIGENKADQQVAGGADIRGGQDNRSPRIALPPELPKLPEDKPPAEAIPLRIGF